MTCGRAPIDLSPVRLALDQGDQAAVIAFTREVCHLPASDWPYVGQVLWELGTRIGSLENPSAYIRGAVSRLRAQAEASTFGRQVVRDEHRRVIGHVTIGSYVRRSDGCVSEEILSLGLREGEAALPYIPLRQVDSPRDSRRERADAWQAQWVETDDPDERDVQRLQMQGVSRGDMAARLGWDERRAERVRLRLWRRRRAR